MQSLNTKRLYNKEKNILLKSSMLDHRNDVFLTSGVLLSVLFSKLGIYFVDGLVGIIISIWFLLSGIKLFKESYNVLMDISLDTETKEKIIKMCMKEDGVLLVEDIHSVSIGYKYIVVLGSEKYYKKSKAGVDVREVTGSSPVSSTIKTAVFERKQRFFLTFLFSFLCAVFCPITFDHSLATDRQKAALRKHLFRKVAFCFQPTFFLVRRGVSSFFISSISSANLRSHSSSVEA